MLRRELNRASNIALEAVNATARHLQRIAGLVCAALARATQEVDDLVWDYQELAGDLRHKRGRNRMDNVISIDARRRATG